MASNRLNFTISIKDKMSPVLRKIQETTGKVRESISKVASTPFNSLTSRLRTVGETFIQLRRKITENRKEMKNLSNGVDIIKSKLKGLAAAFSLGLVIKTGFKGAMQLEQYRNTLESILQDRDKARKKLAWGTYFANDSTYSMEDIIGGMTKLHSYGIEGDRVLKTTGKTYMEMIGDMASAFNKPMEQAIDAITNTKSGQIRGLRTFGITADMLKEYGKKNKFKSFLDKKGQITDEKEFNRALFELIDSKYGGNMKKQSSTFSGTISTIQGNFKNALSNLAGVNIYGDIVENSPFATLKDKVLTPLADKLIELSKNGTINIWSQSLSEKIGEIVEEGQKAIRFVIKWKDVLIPLTKGIIAAKVAISILTAIMTANPITLAIGAIIIAGTLLYKNWDKIKSKFGELTNYIGQKTEKVRGFFRKNEGLFNILAPGKVLIQSVYSFFKAWDKSKGIGENLKNGFKSGFDTLKKETSKSSNWLKNTKIGKTITNQLDKVKIKFKKNEGFFNILVPQKPMIQSVNSFFKSWDKSKGIGENLKNGFKAGFETLKDETSKSSNWFKNTKIGKGISEQFDNLKKKVKENEGIFNILVPSKMMTECVYSFFNAWDSKKSIFENFKNSSNAAFDSLRNQIQVTKEYMMNSSIGKWVEERITNTKESIFQNMDSIKSKINATTGNIKNSFNNTINGVKSYWNGLKESIVNIIDSIVEYINKIKDRISNPFSGIGDSFKTLPGVKYFFNETSTVDGSHADGLSYVPRDGYIAELHKGERVLTKEENKTFNKGGRNINITLNVTGNSDSFDWGKVAQLIKDKIDEHEDEKLISEGDF